MKKMILGLAAAAVIAPLAVAGSAYAASTPTNLSFEEPASLTLTDGYHLAAKGDTSLTGWTVDGDGVDIVNESLWDAHAGAHSIDLNAYGPGSISQEMATVPNQAYDVTFWMSGNPGAAQGIKTMKVSAANVTNEVQFDTTGKTERNMGWEQRSFTFVASETSTTLTFTSTTNATDQNFFGGEKAAWGPAVDDVTVAAAPNVVKTKVWPTWTGGSVATAAAPTETNWHPTNGDPQSKLHKYDNHEEGVPYYVANNGNKGGGSWFLWK